MASLFEVKPNQDDSLDGIDLLYGIEDMSGGKVMDFFRELALTRGVSDQQAFARLASTIFYPHHIDAYCEGLVVRLHGILTDRNAEAWKLAREELGDCLAYLDIFSDHDILPMPTSVVSKYSQELAWNMMHPGKYQNYAGMFMPKIEQYQRFCDDSGALSDLEERLAYFRELYGESEAL